MRLIDAIQAAGIENLDQYSELAAGLGDVQTVREILEDAPTIDAVSVVRCKHCRHWRMIDEFGDGRCKNPEGRGGIAHSNDFCSRGERADNDGEAGEEA